MGDTCAVTDEGCDLGETEPPLFSYRHACGCAVTADPVYRGPSVPAMDGKVIHADSCLGTIRAYDAGNDEDDWLLDTGHLITGFAEDTDGELLFLGWHAGTVHRLIASPPATPGTWLSEAGCVDEDDPRLPVAGAIPFAPQAPSCSEQSIDKRRCMFLPDDARIFVAPNDGWSFPAGSVLMKPFQSGDRCVGTRLMMRNDDGAGAGWSCRWNEEQTDAQLVSLAIGAEVPGQTPDDPGISWPYPEAGEGVHRHTSPTNFVLGPETAQLNGPAWYASAGV